MIDASAAGRKNESFAELLRRYRGDCNLTQEELADRSGLSVQAIRQLERGNRTAPRTSTVHLLARALELDRAANEAFIKAARGTGPPSPVSQAAPRGRFTEPIAVGVLLLVAGGAVAVAELVPGLAGAAAWAFGMACTALVAYSAGRLDTLSTVERLVRLLRRRSE